MLASLCFRCRRRSIRIIIDPTVVNDVPPDEVLDREIGRVFEPEREGGHPDQDQDDPEHQDGFLRDDPNDAVAKQFAAVATTGISKIPFVVVDSKRVGQGQVGGVQKNGGAPEYHGQEEHG